MGWVLKWNLSKKKKEKNFCNEKHFELYMKKEKTTVESFFIIPSKLLIKFNKGKVQFMYFWAGCRAILI